MYREKTSLYKMFTKEERSMVSSVAVREYIDDVVDVFMRIYPNASREEAERAAMCTIENNIIDIPCVLHNDTTHEKLETSVLATFDWIRTRKPIITGNGTFFKQHAEYTAPTIKVLESWLAKRKQLKNKMFSYQKGVIEYVNLNIGQMNQKVICNAEYGESGTPLSSSYSVYIPPATTGSAKNLTTSLICILELFVSNDNGWTKLKGINELFDFIFIVLRDTTERPHRIRAQFDDTTVVRRLVSMIRRINKEDITVIERFVSSLTEDEKSKIMLAFNMRLVLMHFLQSEMNTIGTYFRSHQVDLENCNEETLKEAGFGVDAPDSIANELDYVSNIIKDTCVYPFIPNDVEVRATNMERELVCVVDTDSLMLHFSHLINEFQTDVGNFKMSCICASAFGTRLFANYIVPEFVSHIMINCGIEDKYYRDKFVFKNEFTFAMMILFQKKMYLNSMFVQEGNPRDIHEIDAKGVSFKKRDTAEFLEPYILDVCDKYLVSVDNISIDNLTNAYYTKRQQVIQSVMKSTSDYKKASIKDESAYEKSKTLPMQMRGTKVWNSIEPNEEILPMDRVYVIPLSWERLESTMQDNVMTRKLYETCKVQGGNDPVICLPETYSEIPVWVKNGIDAEYTSDKLLAPYKQILTAFNVYLPETKGSFQYTKMLYI